MLTTHADVSAPRRSLLALDDLRADELDALLDLGATMLHHPGAWRHRLEGQAVACLLRPRSLELRCALTAAIHRLGALPVLLDLGEEPDDDARALSGTCAAIVVEGAAQRHLRQVVARATVPVINAGNRGNDPCAALAACLALRERFGRLSGLSVAHVGAAGGLAHSLLEAAPLAGFQLHLSAEPGALPDPWVIASAGKAVHLVDDPLAAIGNAHAIVSAARLEPAHRTAMAQALLHTLITGDWEVFSC